MPHLRSTMNASSPPSPKGFTLWVAFWNWRFEGRRKGASLLLLLSQAPGVHSILKLVSVLGGGGGTGYQ